MWARKGDGHIVFWLINRWSHKNPWRPHRPHKPTPHSPPGPGWCWDLQGQRRHVCVGGSGVGPSRAEEACVGVRGRKRGVAMALESYISNLFSLQRTTGLNCSQDRKLSYKKWKWLQTMKETKKNIHSERVQKMTPTRPFIAPRSLLKSKMNSNIFKCNLPALYTTFLSDKFQCLLEPFQRLGLLSIERQVFLAIPALVLKLFNRKSLSGKDY